MRVVCCANGRANIKQSPLGSIIFVIVGRMPQQKVLMCEGGKLQIVGRCWVAGLMDRHLRSEIRRIRNGRLCLR